MKKIVLLYLPVLHEGYLRFFKRHSKEADNLYILGDRILKKFGYQGKEIRAIEPTKIRTLVRALDIFSNVYILTPRNAKSLANLKNCQIVTPNEQISRSVIVKYLPRSKVIYDSWFLRWDESSVLLSNVPRGTKSSRPFDRKIIKIIKDEGQQSSDWWRQVGAALVKNGKIVLKAHNTHLPSEYTPYIYGDPRDYIEAGKMSELCSAIHAEQKIIAEAAKLGISLKGTCIYTTVFPCPVCAKLIAYSGIKRCYFVSGHASLDGQKVLEERGVEIIKVN